MYSLSVFLPLRRLPQCQVQCLRPCSRGPCFGCPGRQNNISTRAPRNVLTVSVSALATGALVVEDHVLGVQEELALQKLGGGLDLVQVAPLRQLRQQPLYCKCHKGQGQAINVKANIQKKVRINNTHVTVKSKSSGSVSRSCHKDRDKNKIIK